MGLGDRRWGTSPEKKDTDDVDIMHIANYYRLWKSAPGVTGVLSLCVYDGVDTGKRQRLPFVTKSWSRFLRPLTPIDVLSSGKSYNYHHYHTSLWRVAVAAVCGEGNWLLLAVVLRPKTTLRRRDLCRRYLRRRAHCPIQFRSLTATRCTPRVHVTIDILSVPYIIRCSLLSNSRLH